MYAPTSLGAPALLRGRHGPPPLLRGRRKTMCTAKGSDIRPGRRGTCTYLLTHSLTHSHTHSLTNSLTHSLTHSPTHPLTHTHTQSLTPSLPHSLTPSLPPSPAHSLTSLHFTSLHFTPSLTYIIFIIIIIIIIIMSQRCLPATGNAERDHKMCGCARKSAEHYFGQRKYGEHTIVLIVCREKKHQSLVELDESEATYSQTTYPTYIHT